MRPRAPRVVIVGGGIAGLAAAWECRRQGVPVTLLEGAPRAGGVIRTDVVDDVVLDAGPDAFLVSKPGALDLCRELGIDDQLIGMSPPRGAFVLRGDRLHALPDGGAFGIATRAWPLLTSTLLSPFGKARIALEPLVPRRRATTDESAAAFFRRRFGAEATRHIAQPLLGGIHVGDLERLSADAVLAPLVSAERQGHSVLLALRRQGRRATPSGPFRSFPGGMGTLVTHLAGALGADTLRLDAPVVGIERTATTWNVVVGGATPVSADVLVLATPAHVTAGWLARHAPAAAAAAGAIRYVSSAGVLAVYRDTAIARPLAGSGYVSTPGPGRDPLLATSWLTHKWAGRAPQGFSVLRGFFGGAFDEAVLANDDAALTAMAHASWETRFGVAEPPVLARVVRWTRASPQHEVGHAGRVRTVDEALDALPPLAVCGSGFRAVGIPDVVTDARTTMRRLLDRWRAG